MLSSEVLIRLKKLDGKNVVEKSEYEIEGPINIWKVLISLKNIFFLKFTFGLDSYFATLVRWSFFSSFESLFWTKVHKSTEIHYLSSFGSSE